jgi:hypothetical protein
MNVSRTKAAISARLQALVVLFDVEHAGRCAPRGISLRPVNRSPYSRRKRR